MTEEEALQVKLMLCGCHQLSIWEGNSNIWNELLLLWRARTTTLQDEQQTIQRSCTWPTALPVHLQSRTGRRHGPEWWQRRKGYLIRWSEVIQIFNCWQIPSAGCASKSVTGGSKWQRFLFFSPGWSWTREQQLAMMHHPSWDWRRGCRGSTFWRRSSCPPFFNVLLLSRVSWAALGMAIRMCFLGADVYHCHVSKSNSLHTCTPIL